MMNIQKSLLTNGIFLSMLLSCILSYAQPQERPVKERLQSMKIAFFTQKLSLSPDEAKTFWPIYDAFTEELETARKANRRREQKIRRNFDSLSDDELETLSDGYIEHRKKEYEIYGKYHKQFKEVLPIRKVIKLYKAEQEFRKKILNEFRNRRNNGKQKDD